MKDVHKKLYANAYDTKLETAVVMGNKADTSTKLETCSQGDCAAKFQVWFIILLGKLMYYQQLQPLSID